MTLPPCLRFQGGTLFLSVKAQPRASRNAVAEIIGNELKVKITAPPVDSAANEALVEFLAETLGCPRGAVQLVRGGTSRHKVFALHGVTVETAAQKLAAK